MKPVYLGAVRGYEPPTYRPGLGWSAGDTSRRSNRGAPVFSGRRAGYSQPLIATRRRRGLRGKVTLLSLVIIVAAVVALVLRGVMHLL